MIDLRSLITLIAVGLIFTATPDAQQPRVRSPWLLPSSKDFPSRPPLAGCYLLNLQDSRGPSRWPATLPFAYAPARLHIQTSKHERNSIQYEAATGPGGIQGPSLKRPALQRPHPDSIVINFDGGLHGVSLRFRFQRGGWVGRAYEISDVNADGNVLGDVIARPVECMVWLREFRDFRAPGVR